MGRSVGRSASRHDDGAGDYRGYLTSKAIQIDGMKGA